MADTKSVQSGYATDFIKGDWATARFVDDQNVDNLLSVVVNLGAELWAVRRRQMVLEALLEKHQVLAAGALDAYVPTEPQRVSWSDERDDTIARVYSALSRVSERKGGVPPKNDRAAPLKSSS